ncbi:MAG TPA: hypothetical protein G4O07_08745 [Dehalococcoidia bacterium]|nr:hypothetical protein [Dehalococcoidia bacterium]
MDINDERIRDAVERTVVLRSPQQTLFTFGRTNIYYYLVTEPAYVELVGETSETVIREGRVLAEKPQIVTPYYLSGLEGFSSDAKKYFESLIENYGPNIPGLLYSYRNEPKELNIVSSGWQAVVDRLNTEIDERNDPLSAIIKGPDELWDVSLVKFIFEMTQKSVGTNLGEMGARGLLNVDTRGIPTDARIRIEELFTQVERGEVAPEALKVELDRWNVYDEYEDRFLGIFRNRR